MEAEDLWCNCRPETRQKPDEFSGKINTYYDYGCPLHDEEAFRAEVLKTLKFLNDKNKE